MFLQLNVLANIIIAQYFPHFKCFLYFSDNTRFHYNNSLQFVNVHVQNGTFDAGIVFRFHGCQGVVVSTDEPVEFLQNFEYEIRNNLDRFNFRRYLILPGLRADAMAIFDCSLLEFIADLVVVNSNDDFSLAEFELWTHQFTGSNELVLLDKWFAGNSSFLYNNDLYPDKLENGYGRTFKVATFTYKPYSVPAYLDGTEMLIALEFVKRHNLTMSLVIDEAGEWGEIYDNWTGYGILGNLLYDNADVGLAALYSWSHEHNFLDLSMPVIRTGITCLTPAPKLAGGWLVPFLSFTYEMWTAVGISFLVCAVTLFLFDFFKARAPYYDKNEIEKRKNEKDLLEDSLLNTATIFLLQSVTNTQRVNRNIAKYMYGCMFLFSLLVATTYSSGLASSMTVPRYVGAIKTVQELVDSGIQWGATSIAWIMSIMDAPERKYVVLVNRFVKTDGPRLRKYNNRRFAFSIERLPAGQFAIGEYITESGVADLRLMTEDVYWEYCVLMTKKSSIWLPSINNLILRLHETGIPNIWEYRVATTHLNPKIQRAVRYSRHHTPDAEPIVLRWKHVEGTFGIWLIGIAVSICCFVFEVITHARHRSDFAEVH